MREACRGMRTSGSFAISFTSGICRRRDGGRHCKHKVCVCMCISHSINTQQQQWPALTLHLYINGQRVCAAFAPTSKIQCCCSSRVFNIYPYVHSAVLCVIHTTHHYISPSRPLDGAHMMPPVLMHDQCRRLAVQRGSRRKKNDNNDKAHSLHFHIAHFAMHILSCPNPISPYFASSSLSLPFCVNLLYLLAPILSCKKFSSDSADVVCCSPTLMAWKLIHNYY